MTEKTDRSRREVRTLHGNRYPLGERLGAGGQGSVWSVPGERLAVKLLRRGPAAQQERLRDQLAMVGRLPLEDLHVARPLQQLAPPDLGYVMELLQDMVPLGKLAFPPPDVPSLVRWYFETGGLRQRLRLLARVADILAGLHGRGLVYVDPSPNNVFVSSSPEELEVRLIDADNLRTATHPGTAIYTPRYGAPEVATGKGACSTLSDVHAFAVMAFETLTLVHPLIGDMVADGEPELEERALSGKLPWIDHSKDDSNHSSHGIPREMVLTQKLMEDFRLTFEEGLVHATRRPGMARFTRHLHRAADRTVPCSCGGTSNFSHRRCPFCDEPRGPFLVAGIMLWDPDRARHAGAGEVVEDPGLVLRPDGKPRVQDAVAIGLGETARLTDRVLHGSSGNQPLLSVTFHGKHVTLAALTEDRWTLTKPDGEPLRSLDMRPVDVSVARGRHALWLHSGTPENLHRVVRFDVQGGDLP